MNESNYEQYRDASFTYDDFVNRSIEELRDNNGGFYAFVDFNANGEGKIRECPIV